MALAYRLDKPRRHRQFRLLRKHYAPLARLRRLAWRGLQLFFGSLLLFSLIALVQGWTAFGKGATGARLLRMQHSPNYRDGHFANPQPLFNDFWGMLQGMWHASDHVNPSEPPAVAKLSKQDLAAPPASGLRVTWFGHSSMLIEIDGKRLLTDPMWSERASPLGWLGPKRWYPAPIALEDLPKLDAVLISHDHYDHLDYGSVLRLNRLGVKFVVPLGVGAHLEYWGVPAERIIELDWWERTQLLGLTIVCTPARHASGRFLFDKDAKLWAGYALLGDQHRAYYSGDTGLFPAMREIGEKLGPFDVTMIETGQYHRAWPDWHIGPEQAVRAHQLVRGRVMLPVHWALLGLALHGWTEPVERSLVAAHARQAVLATPRPGEPFEPSVQAPRQRWWPEVPWETAAQHPIVSTNAE
jgi:L-ascorbate metabolism protein UlaG (beta-lactamase superfamily)